MSAFSRFSLLLLCAVLPSVRMRAQTPAAATAPAVAVPPPPAAHSHAPASASHAHATVVLDQFVTSAAPFPRNQVDLAQATTVLSGRSLLLKQQTTLGETLAGEPGMSATSFGPGASRPIIRGLGGDRIRLLENSVGTLDASITSPDHAVSVEPFLVERIEVLRGPASLLYGSNAVGGVVNVITHRIETDLPTEPVRGSLEMRGGSAAGEFARGGVLDVALKPAADRAVVLHVDAFRRSADDVRIPGFAESARIRAEETAEAAEHGEPAPVFAHGRLPNSALDTTSGAAGVSFVSAAFHIGASYSGFDSNYGIPGHGHENEHEDENSTVAASTTEAAGVRIDLEQRRTDIQAEWHGETGLLRGARFKFGHARYRHAELEPDGAVGTLFTNQGHEARLELLHGDAQPWSGAIGAQATRSDFGASGEEAFLPPSRTDTAAIFAFEEIAVEPVTWQFGARLQRNKISAAGRGAARRDDELSASAGAVWKLDDASNLAFSITHTGRAPNAQELFANGPHAGTQSFEIGDATLETERSLGAELGLRRRSGDVTGAVTLFTNRFRGYVFEEPTGMVAIEHEGEWEFLPPDDAEAHEHGGGLPVYRYAQRDAQFWGAELEAVWHLHEENARQLDLRFAADFTRARAGGRNLPRIPAARMTAGVLWATPAWSAGVESQFVFEQDRVAANESTSEGYVLVSAHVARVFTLGRAECELFLRGTNLANEEIRPHTSFVKELAPLAARGVVAGIRVAF